MIPCRILVIAPYESMKNILLFICKDRPEVRLTVMVGDLGEGARLVQEIDEEEFDIVISRGGTAEAIRRCTDLKVVDIPLSVYDILRSIKLAENHNCKYAVIGFPAITRNATFLCEVLRYNVDIYTIHDQKEARTILQGLENSGCQMVLCDVVTNSLAQEYGIPALLITSGIESVEDALNTAVQEGLARRKALELAQFFQDVPCPMTPLSATRPDRICSSRSPPSSPTVCWQRHTQLLCSVPPSPTAAALKRMASVMLCRAPLSKWKGLCAMSSQSKRVGCPSRWKNTASPTRIANRQ